MARIRSLKPEAFQSETLAEISLGAERTFFGLSTIADDRGRFVDKPAQINGELWSMRGNHTRDDLEAELVELEKCDEPLVCRYVGCDGKRYGHLITWDSHQKIDKPSQSRLPRCPHHLVSSKGFAEPCRHEGDCPSTADSMLPFEASRHSRDTLASPPEGSGESQEGSMVDLGSRTLDRGSRTEESRTGATLPGTALLDAYLAKTSPRPPKEDVRKLTEVIDRLVDEKTPVDVIAEALERYRDKTQYGPGLLRRLAGDVIKDRTPPPAGKTSRGQPRGHQPYRNPEDDSAYEGDL